MWRMAVANVSVSEPPSSLHGPYEPQRGRTHAPLQGSWSRGRQTMLVVGLALKALKGGGLGALAAENAMSKMLALTVVGHAPNASKLCACSIPESLVRPLTSGHGRDIKYV